MSGDIAQPAADSAPQSTADIASSVIQEAEAQESTPVESAPAPVGEAPKPSAAEELLKAEGYNPKRVDGRDNLIPWSRVVKIIEKGITEGKGEFGEKFAKLTSEHEMTAKEAAELRAFRDQFATALRGDETAFLREIATHDPRYARFLQQQAQAQAQPAAPVSDGRPEPDVDLGNGQRTYSLAGIDKLVAWQTKQLLDVELKPYRDREKQEQERAKLEAAEASRITSVRQHIADAAATWPNYADYKPEIERVMREDSAQAETSGVFQFKTLKEAYLHVQNQKLAADDTAKRAKWLDEMNKAPKSTSIARPGIEHRQAAGPRSTAEIARQIISEAS